MKAVVIGGVLISLVWGGMTREAAAAYNEWILSAWPIYWGTTIREVGKCPRTEDGRKGHFIRGDAWWAAGSLDKSLITGVRMLSEGPLLDGTGYKARLKHAGVYSPDPTWHFPVVLYMEIKCRYQEADTLSDEEGDELLDEESDDESDQE